jgi:hypothetical protein
MVGHPRHHRALHGHRAERREQVLDRLEGRERPVREQPVEAERHAEARQHVHDRQHGEVAPVDELVPEQDDRRDERDEREDDPDEVGDLVRARHALCPTPEDRILHGPKTRDDRSDSVAS